VFCLCAEEVSSVTRMVTSFPLFDFKLDGLYSGTRAFANAPLTLKTSWAEAPAGEPGPEVWCISTPRGPSMQIPPVELMLAGLVFYNPYADVGGGNGLHVGQLEHVEEYGRTHAKPDQGHGLFALGARRGPDATNNATLNQTSLVASATSAGTSAQISCYAYKDPVGLNWVPITLPKVSSRLECVETLIAAQCVGALDCNDCNLHLVACKVFV